MTLFRRNTYRSSVPYGQEGSPPAFPMQTVCFLYAAYDNGTMIDADNRCSDGMMIPFIPFDGGPGNFIGCMDQIRPPAACCIAHLFVAAVRNLLGASVVKSLSVRHYYLEHTFVQSHQCAVPYEIYLRSGPLCAVR
jgi:hypothetical protein